MQRTIRDTIDAMGSFDNPSNLDVLAEDNIRTLKLPDGRLNQPLGIILVGVPSSGKTFLVEKLAAALPLAIISEEQMLKFLAPRLTFLERAQEEILSLAVKTTEKLIQRGVSCIFDYSVKKREQRALLKQTIEAAAGKYVLIHIDLPKEEAYRQVSKSNYEITRGEKKGLIMDKDLFEYEVASTTPPTLEERALKYNPQNSDSLNTLVEQVSKLGQGL